MEPARGERDDGGLDPAGEDGVIAAMEPARDGRDDLLADTDAYREWLRPQWSPLVVSGMTAPAVGDVAGGRPGRNGARPSWAG